jgi:hypothetical protein
MATATSLPPAPEAEVREYLKVWAESAGQALTQIAAFLLHWTAPSPRHPKLPIPYGRICK